MTVPAASQEEGGFGERGPRWLALRPHSLPFSLQFFLFILIIFLAELSAAILAFIFRENVRTGPTPCSLLPAGPVLGTHRDVSLSLSQHAQPTV